MTLHHCDLISPSQAYGDAIAECDEDDEGRLWAGNREYGSQVNVCPVCGYHAVVPATTQVVVRSPRVLELEKAIIDLQALNHRQLDQLANGWTHPNDVVCKLHAAEALIEANRWRFTLSEPPPWRTRVLARSNHSWMKPGEYWYDVTTYERMPYTPFKPGWRGDCGWGDPAHYPEWRPLP